MSYNWIGEMKLIISFLIVYIPLYKPITDNIITPYLVPYADAWFTALFMLVWDRLPIVFIGAAILGGVLRSQLQEPRSQIEEIPFY